MISYIKVGKYKTGRPKKSKEDKKAILYISVNGELCKRVKDAFKKSEYNHLTDYLNVLLVPELIKQLDKRGE
jgi:hypothetical protein